METNPSIACSVTECQYNNTAAKHCTLDKIVVGKQQSQTTKAEETDCESFQVKHSDSMS